MKNRFVRILVVAFLVMSPMSYAEEALDVEGKNPDPWIGLNKFTHKFNEKADRWVLKPAAKAYKAVLPGFVKKAVRNVFANLGDVNIAANSFLQGKGGNGVSDVSRIVINTTIGVGGLFDPASAMGLVKHNEDFGQTFRKWGIPSGPYLVLPLLGPSTLTDALGRPFDTSLDPVRQLEPVRHRNVVYAVDIVRTREELLGAEKAVFGDTYIFYRDAYLQRREYLAKDGKIDYSAEDDF